MGGSVAVAANHGHAGQGGALLRAHHVHNALALAHEGEESGSAKLGNIGIQRGDLFLADGVSNALIAQFPAIGGRVVVGRCHHRADAPQLATCQTQPFKSLGAGDFVHQMAVDVEDGGAIFFGVDDVLVKNLVVKRAAHMLFSASWGGKLSR